MYMYLCVCVWVNFGSGTLLLRIDVKGVYRNGVEEIGDYFFFECLIKTELGIFVAKSGEFCLKFLLFVGYRVLGN